jgi:hypothetical protein
MKVAIHRSRDLVSICVQQIVELIPCTCAKVVYPTGSCLLVQPNGWDEFVVLQQIGSQFSKESLCEMIGEIKEHEIPFDDRVIVLERDEP